MSNNGPDLRNVLWYNQLGMHDVDRVGGKNASLGEMITNLSDLGVAVPNGFATTAQAFNDFLEQSGVNQRIYQLLDQTDVDDVAQLAKAGAQIRQWVIDTPFHAEFEREIHQAYQQLADGEPEASFAVRSSATAEDMPDASFAGQQETFLNVQGIDAVMVAIKHVFASLFNDRAISYRVHQGYDHRGVALSAGVQRMVRSDLASSGVMFTIDTESGFDQVVFITSAFGLGEMVVQGAVNPDEFYVHKPTLQKGKPAIVRRNLGSKKIRMVYAPSQDHGKQVRIEDVPEAQRSRFSLTDDEVQALAQQAILIEKHYGRPMDIEWAKDGHTGKLLIVQARPETVRSNEQTMERYQLNGSSPVLVEGRAIGHRIGAGPVKVIHDISEMDRILPGDVLVTDMTDPDWEPIMKKAAAIVTNRGGRTCHAAIIALQQLRQRAVVYLIGQIVADGAEGLLARELIAAQQLEELVHVGHRAPFTVDFGMILRRFIRGAHLGGLQRQRRVFFAQVALHQRHPGRQIGLFGGVDLVQRIALLVEELDAVAHAAFVGFAHSENAGPVVEEQAQIQLARVEDQPGVAVEVLVAVAAHLLMHRIAVAGDGFGDAHLLKLGQQGARVGLQAASVVADAGVCQLRFADAKDRRQIAGVFAGVVDFGLLVAFV